MQSQKSDVYKNPELLFFGLKHNNIHHYIQIFILSPY